MTKKLYRIRHKESGLYLNNRKLDTFGKIYVRNPSHSLTVFYFNGVWEYYEDHDWVIEGVEITKVLDIKEINKK